MERRNYKKDTSYTELRHQHIFDVYGEVLKELENGVLQGLNRAVSKRWLYETVADRTGYSPEWVRNVICRMLRKSITHLS